MKLLNYARNVGASNGSACVVALSAEKRLLARGFRLQYYFNVRDGGLKMSADETQCYGLSGAAYKDLMRLLEFCPSYLGEGKRDSRKRKKADKLTPKIVRDILLLADSFTERHMPLPTAVRAVLNAGWTGESPSKTIERYRKSKQRKQEAIEHYPVMEDPELELQHRLRSAWMDDDSKRAGPPEGPLFCESKKQVVGMIGRTFAEVGLAVGFDYLENPRLLSIPNPETREDNLDPDAIKKQIETDADVPDCLTTESLYYLIGLARSHIVTQRDLRNLRGINVYIPLDCPKDRRDLQLDSIISEYQRLRREYGIPIEIRSRSEGLRESLRTLPIRIKQLSGKKTASKAIQNPHSTPGVEAHSNPVTSFVSELRETLRFNNISIDYKVLEDCVKDAYASALKSADHGA